MKKNNLKNLWIGLFLFFVNSTLIADNWPNWRGPKANGVAPNGNPPAEFSEHKNVQWKINLPGSGSSTPVIWKDEVFILAAEKTGKKAAGSEDETPNEQGNNNSQRRQRPEGRGRSSERGSSANRGGFGGNSFNRDEMMKRFDKDGDGELNDTERQAMRDEFRQQFSRNRGSDRRSNERSRRGGRSGSGSSRGGFGGGRKPTEEYRFSLISYDRESGKENWRSIATTAIPHEGHHRDHGYASASPVTDGKNIIVSFGSRGLYCFDMKGKIEWKKDFGDMRTRNSFGEGSSPTLHENTIVLLWDQEDDSYIYAINKKNGKIKWKRERNEATGWCTPVVTTHKGVTQVLVNGSKAVRSYRLNDGKLLWQCSGQTGNPVPSIVVDKQNAYAMSGFRGAYIAAIKLGGDGDLTGTESVAWTANRGTPYVPSPLLSNDRIWYLAGNNGILSVRDTKSGKSLIEGERLTGISGVYASPVSASGKVYIVGRNGSIIVLKDSAKFEVLASNKLDEKFDCSPAIVGNQLFLRGKEHLYCIANN